MNDITVSTANNAIVITDDDHVTESPNRFLIAATYPVLNIEPTVHSRPSTDEQNGSSTEEGEENEGNAVQPTEDVERVQPTKSAEGADDDFRPAKKRKVRESNDVEVDEVRVPIWSLIL